MRLASPKLIWNDLLMALSLLTRLPLPHANWSDTKRPQAKAAWAYPIAGAFATLPALCIGLLGQSHEYDPSTLALLMLAATTVITGAMHEDGLADCADGFWGGWDKARRLEIMKDSSIGTYGAIALMFVLALKWSALSLWLSNAGTPLVLVFFAMLSRAAMSVMMQLLPQARRTGLSVQTGTPGWPATLGGLALSLAVGLAVLSPIAVMLALAAASAMTVCCGLAARAKIGGQTGDVLGATQQLSELAMFTMLTAAMAGSIFVPV